MITLQNIIYPPYSTFSPEASSYIRGSDKLRVVNNILVIPQYEKVDFNTYINFFSVKKWKAFTQIHSLILNIKIIGKAIVDIVGIRHRGNKFPEIVLSSVLVEQAENTQIDIHGFRDYDAIYFRVQTLEESVEVIYANFSTTENIRQQVRLGICVATCSQYYPLRDTVTHLLQLFSNTDFDINFFIVNQGEWFDFNPQHLDKVQVVQQCDLGQAGGVAKAINLAMQAECTNLLIIHDDLEVSFEAIFRTVRFLQMLIAERRDIFLTGAVLSSEERWKQLERNTIVDNQIVIPIGKGQDTRDINVAIENTLSDSIRGSAKWSFCAFSSKIVRDYGYPMPLYNQGIDLEFATRANKETVGINGICGWKPPTAYTYDAISEDYYYIRNIIINALLAPRPMIKMIDHMVWKRFWHNIRSYNYVGARLNLYAVNHILRKKYHVSAIEVNHWVKKVYATEHNQVKYIYVGKSLTLDNQTSSNQNLVNNLAIYINPIKKKLGISEVGENRQEKDFFGKTEVYVLNSLTGNAEIARLKRKKIAKLSAQMIKSYALLLRNYKEIRKDLLLYRDEVTTPEYWKGIFDDNAH